MGDRALIIFTDGKEVSPTVYLHWAGEQVPELLKEHKTLMATRLGDVSYAAARFIGIVHASREKDNLSLGVWNTEADIVAAVQAGDKATLEAHSHGDAGVVVVDVNDYSWKAYGGYLSKKKKAA